MECASVRQCFNTSTFNSMQMYFYFRKTPHPFVSDFLTCRKQERVQQWFFSFKTFTVYQHRCSKDGREIAGVVRQFGKILKRKKAQNFQKKALFWENKALFRTKYLLILYLLFQNLL